MTLFFEQVIQPEADKLDQLVQQIHTDLALIQASANPTDEELGF